MRPVFLLIILISFPFIGCLAEKSLIDQYNEFAIRAAKEGLWREAAFRWERIIQIDPRNAKAHNNLAVAYEAMGRLEEAEKHYKLALELDPDNKAIQENYLRFKRSQRRREGTGEKGSG